MPPKVLGSRGDLRRLRKWLVHPRGTLGEVLVGAHCQTWTILDSGQSPAMSQHRGFWQPYSNFWNRPYPLHRISVQFEWAEPFGELQKNPKMGHFLGHVSFRRKKNVCLSTQLGACSHPTGRPTVPYWCTIDVRTPWAHHGVPTGAPGPR